MMGQYYAELEDDDNYYIGSYFEDEYNLYEEPSENDYYYGENNDNNPYKNEY